MMRTDLTLLRLELIRRVLQDQVDFAQQLDTTLGALRVAYLEEMIEDLNGSRWTGRRLLGPEERASEETEILKL